jgi:3',5'-cyclic AMP phosphodiesterase CpdA
MWRGLALVVLVVATVAAPVAPPLTLPSLSGSCRFAVIGDSGTGGEPQYRVGERLAEARTRFPFDVVLMLGDNVYGADRAVDMERKFTRPYRTLLDAGVTFRAALGNHDDPRQRFFAPFHMEGRRYYTFRCSRDSVRFFALDSNYMTPEQVAWLEDSLRAATERWKIAYFHHPIYSTGATHGSDVGLRKTLEPLLLAHGVDVVFNGHEHFYERLRPQHGVQYFIAGGAGKLNRDDIGRDPALFAKGYDRGHHFMLVEVAGDALFFQAVSDDGVTIDAGTIRRRPGP